MLPEQTLVARCRLRVAGFSQSARRSSPMSVYKVVELIGTSSQSWEDAATTAVKTAGASLRDLRVAEVVQQDLDVGEGGSVTFRTKLRVSFKYEGGD
jgi:flavin-binding protein dodecin